jgi:alpha-ketoglutarate-dependent taurine dioxygenase
VSLTFIPLSLAMGCEVKGFDPAVALDDAELERLVEHWTNDGILLFRGLAGMTVGQQIAFSRRLGELDVDSLSAFTVPDHPEIFVVSNVVEEGRALGVRVSPSWHSDGQYLERPTAGSFLHAKEVPNGHGDTLFANMYAAHAALSAPMKRRIAELRVIHSRVKTHAITFPNWPPLTDEQKTTMLDVEHPLVRTHPITGRKALYVGGNSAWSIVGMTGEEAASLIAELRAFATEERFVYRHRWTAGDAILWDNRCTMHCPTSFDMERHRRIMYRTTIKGDVPF